jgi:nucleoid-associated protein YgaU
MRPAVSRLARSGRILAALLVGCSVACGGGGGGGGSQPTVAATVVAPSPAASPQRPALASPVSGGSPVVPAVSGSPTTASAGGATGNEQTYEIQSGDTLLSIAEQFYGDASQWRTIYDANRDVIGNNPDALKVGTTLKIPPKPS